MQQVRIDELVAAHAHALSARLQAHRARLYPPDARKPMRRFAPGEVARLLGVGEGCLRRLRLEGRGPEPATGPNGRRLYSTGDIRALRETLEAGAPGRYLPGRREGDHLQVVAVINFKGGSAKTTTAAHMAQRCALDGYRVLAIDLDPQASLSALHGVQPELDLPDGGTLHDAIRYEDPVPLRDLIRPTCIAGLDLVPGNLDLMEFEHETPRVLAGRGAPAAPFFTRIGEALATVEDGYDLAIVDCPPQLGFLTMGALCAATAVLVTIHPQMLDMMSMCQFLLMTSDLLGVVAEAGGDMSYDWFRYLVTRYEPGDGPQNQMVGFMRALFGEHVLANAVLKSTAISDAGMTKQTLYEVEKGNFTRSTYERAIESLDAVNAEIGTLIQQAWGR